MSNPSKAKGTAAETALLRWLHGHGHPEVVRNPPSGASDVGDLTVWIDGPEDDEGWVTDVRVVIEVKSVKDVARGIREGLAELEAEKRNAQARHGVLVVKRHGTSDPGEWYAIRRACDDPELGA